MKDINKLINEILENNKTKSEIILKKEDINLLLSYLKHQNDLYENALKSYDKGITIMDKTYKIIYEVYDSVSKNIYNRNELLTNLKACIDIFNEKEIQNE